MEAFGANMAQGCMIGQAAECAKDSCSKLSHIWNLFDKSIQPRESRDQDHNSTYCDNHSGLLNRYLVVLSDKDCTFGVTSFFRPFYPAPIQTLSFLQRGETVLTTDARFFNNTITTSDDRLNDLGTFEEVEYMIHNHGEN